MCTAVIYDEDEISRQVLLASENCEEAYDWLLSVWEVICVQTSVNGTHIAVGRCYSPLGKSASLTFDHTLERKSNTSIEPFVADL